MEGSDDNCKSINSTEHQTSESSSLNLSKTENANNVMNNHPMRVEYDPESMWFDYQALFDQTKIWVLHDYPKILEEVETIPVQHTDFEKNTLDKKALFGDYVDNHLIYAACIGSDPAIGELLSRSAEYLSKYGCECSQDDDNYLTVFHNFKFLLAISAQFSYFDNCAYRKEYLILAGKYNNNNLVPDNIGGKYITSIDDSQLYKVLTPIF